MEYETRDDGWPLCPRCEEDELWSPLIWDGNGKQPPIAAYIAAGVRCYLCGWDSTAISKKDDLKVDKVYGYRV